MPRKIPTIRKPESLSRARVDSMKKKKVAEFLNTLVTVVGNNNLRGRSECICNVGETGMLLSNRPPNIVAQKGAKDVVSMTSVERGENVTVLACMNAAGQYITPLKMKNKATTGIKIKTSSAKQSECQVPQDQSTSSQLVQPQDQSSSAEQVQSKIKVQVQATSTKPLDNIVLSTSSQQSESSLPHE